MPLDLALVMPVYNEEECIESVIRSWLETLRSLGLKFKMIVLNDGSRDNTKEVLAAFADDERVEIVNKKNSGHGPTILMGYHRAIDLAEWVFQCDSDDEMRPEHFPRFWKERSGYDALFGVRAGRQQDAGRSFISACSRLTVKALYGSGVADVNVPYRLIRSAVLGEIVRQIPPDTFAPNIVISGAISRAKLKIINLPVPHEGRRTGTVSITNWKLWKAAIRSLGQTIRCRPVIAVERVKDLEKVNV